MFEVTDVTTRAVSVTGIEILALKKLAIISKALADSLPPSARAEQISLVRVLVSVTNRLEGTA